MHAPDNKPLCVFRVYDLPPPNQQCQTTGSKDKTQQINENVTFTIINEKKTTGIKKVQTKS